MAHVLECPRCGAPLPPRARRVVVVCTYCGATVSLDGEIVRRADFKKARARDGEEHAHDARLVHVAGEPYIVRGSLAHGASSEVYWGERARRARELVVLKVLRAEADADLFAREWEILGALASSRARGTAHFSSFVPEPVARGVVEKGGVATDRAVHVVRYKSGFSCTLSDVADAFGDRLDPRHAVWMWRRILEVLGWIHDSGFAHGAVLPEHVVLHPRDHGAMLVGFSAAERIAESAPLRAYVEARKACYPRRLLAGPAPVSAADDLFMAARTIAFVLGGEARMPGALRELLHADATDARALHAQVGAAARAEFGPPTFVPFSMP